MSTTITEPAADVVLMGVGVVSGTVAAELTAAGFTVAGICRGPYWNYSTDFATTKYDEWGIQFERKFDTPYSWGAQTIRNNANQFALPIRRPTFSVQYHSLGLGVGSTAHHYGGAMGRGGPWSFQTASMDASRYGATHLNDINPFNDMTDWPGTYADYEPYFTTWEQNFGLSGSTAGSNGSGAAMASGSVVPGTPLPMSKNYPLPGHPDTPLGTYWSGMMTDLGYNVFHTTNSLASAPYVNGYGVSINECVYDGWCGASCNFVCETGAKANANFRTVPAALKTGKMTLSLNSDITRANLNTSTGLIESVTYYDAAGNVHIQPGTVFFSGLWGGNQVRNMLLSGVGNAYNPTTVTGSVGRGYSNGYLPFSGTAGPSGSIPGLGLNSISAGNASGGYTIFEFMEDGFDHTGLSFIGGVETSGGGFSGGGPSNLSTAGASSAGSQGSAYKQTLQGRYNKGGSAAGVSFGGMPPDLVNTLNMWDLDPHYNDIWGDPLPRITHEWTPNPYQGATYFASSPGNTIFLSILNSLKATNISKGGTTIVAPYTDHNDWWGHHIRGGNRLGASASSSTFNQWQQSWTCSNLFAAGEVNNATGNTTPSGTHQAGGQSQVAAEGIKMYLASPGQLTTSL